MTIQFFHWVFYSTQGSWHLGKMVPLCEQNEKMSIVLFWCCPYLAEPLVTSGMPVKKAQLLSKKLPIHPSYSRDVAQQSC